MFRTSGNKPFPLTENPMLKTTALAALSAITFSSPAIAGHGIALESIIVFPNSRSVRVDYANKIRDCGILIDDDGARAQARPYLYCDQGTELNATYPYRGFDFVPGDSVSMCAAHNARNCTDTVSVRVAGDVNDDGAINVLDLMIMHDAAMGETLDSWPVNNADELSADMNQDGEINVIDILLLVRAIKAEW